MNTTSSANGGYRVECSQIVANSFRELQKQATREGRGEAFLAAFRQVIQRLSMNPSSAGEPTYLLPALRLQMRIVVIRPLIVDFAVSEVHRIVFIRSGRLLS